MAELGGLGAGKGPPATHLYAPPSPIPLLLPWLGVFLLLLLKPNRAARAWWIWAPLLLLTALEWSLPALTPLLSQAVTEVYPQIFSPLPFGLAGLWLLIPFWARRSRGATLLYTFISLAGFSILAQAVRESGESELIPFPFYLIPIGLCSLVIGLAITLAGLTSREHHSPVRIILSLGAWLVAVGFLVTGPIFLFALIVGETPPPLEFALVTLAVSGLAFLVQLPFLILAFCSDFFRERLHCLLHLKERQPPPPVPTSPLISPVRAT